MRTDWAGSSMTVAPISDAYAPTVVANGFARAAGDPAKVAQAVRRLVEMNDPPVRILLGSDALTVAKAATEALAKSDTSVEELSRSTDHDDATPAELDPLGVGARP
jgi:hypothetical protein